MFDFFQKDAICKRNPLQFYKQRRISGNVINFCFLDDFLVLIFQYRNYKVIHQMLLENCTKFSAHIIQSEPGRSIGALCVQK